jgi:hypothetical protein
VLVDHMSIAGYRSGKGQATGSNTKLPAHVDTRPLEEGERQEAPSDGADGSAIDHELGAVDRGGAVGGEIGDEVSHLFRFGSPPD